MAASTTSVFSGKFEKVVNLPPPSVVYLSVPREDWDLVQAAGGRVDAAKNLWSVDGNRYLMARRFFDRWQNIKVINGIYILGDSFPGEDRSFGGRQLFVDMIPRGSWFKNARSATNEDDWGNVRRLVYARAHDRCECCTRKRGSVPNFSTGEPLSLDAHERWDFVSDGTNHTQRLRRIIALCDDCHDVTHWGFNAKNGYEAQAVAHYAWVQNLTFAEVDKAVNLAYARNEYRSQYRWDIDVGVLKQAGVTVLSPAETAQNEARAAERADVDQQGSVHYSTPQGRGNAPGV